jgi:hypothetical protein
MSPNLREMLIWVGCASAFVLVTAIVDQAMLWMTPFTLILAAALSRLLRTGDK